MVHVLHQGDAPVLSPEVVAREADLIARAAELHRLLFARALVGLYFRHAGPSPGLRVVVRGLEREHLRVAELLSALAPP